MDVQEGGLGAISFGIPEWLVVLILIALVALGIWKAWAMLRG